MRLRFKETLVEMNTPESYAELVDQIAVKFNVTDVKAKVVTTEGTYMVTSTPEYQNIPNHTINEVEVLTDLPMHDGSLPFNQFDSIDTCTSHEKTDSEESKHSEVSSSLLNSTSRIQSTTKQVSETQTEKNFKDTSTSTHLEKVHFEVQYDQPLIIEHEKLKEFFKKSLVEMQSSNKQKFVHQNFICHICQCTPIIGVRYECLECKVNFCEICEEINPHEHDRLVHKGNLKVIDTVNDTKDTFIKKLFEMGFDDVKKVRIVAEKYKYDLNKTVNDLLFN